MKVSLAHFQAITKDKFVTETPNSFRRCLNLGRGTTFELFCPKELPVRSPGIPVDPFTFIADIFDPPSHIFGDVYEDNAVLSVIPGEYFYITKGRPEHLDVSVDTSRCLPPDALLVAVEYPLDNPPAEAQRGSELGQRLGARYYCRVDHTDSDADFSDDHGTDLWVLPIEKLGDTYIQEIQRAHAEREALAELEFRRYYMDAPRYRALLHDGDKVFDGLGWRMEYGEEYAELTFPEKQSPIHVFYNLPGLTALRSIISRALASKMADDLLTSLLGEMSS